MHVFPSGSCLCLPHEPAGLCLTGWLGLDGANISVDAQARWAVTGADSSSEPGYLVPEPCGPEARQEDHGLEQEETRHLPSNSGIWDNEIA